MRNLKTLVVASVLAVLAGQSVLAAPIPLGLEDDLGLVNRGAADPTMGGSAISQSSINAGSYVAGSPHPPSYGQASVNPGVLAASSLQPSSDGPGTGSSSTHNGIESPPMPVKSMQPAAQANSYLQPAGVYAGQADVGSGSTHSGIESPPMSVQSMAAAAQPSPSNSPQPIGAYAGQAKYSSDVGNGSTQRNIASSPMSAQPMAAAAQASISGSPQPAAGVYTGQAAYSFDVGSGSHHSNIESPHMSVKSTAATTQTSFSNSLQPLGVSAGMGHSPSSSDASSTGTGVPYGRIAVGANANAVPFNSDGPSSYGTNSQRVSPQHSAPYGQAQSGYRSQGQGVKAKVNAQASSTPSGTVARSKPTGTHGPIPLHNAVLAVALGQPMTNFIPTTTASGVGAAKTDVRLEHAVLAAALGQPLEKIMQKPSSSSTASGLVPTPTGYGAFGAMGYGAPLQPTGTGRGILAAASASASASASAKPTQSTIKPPSLLLAWTMDDLLFKGKTLQHTNTAKNKELITAASTSPNMSRIGYIVREIGERFLPLVGKQMWKGKEFIKSFGKGLKAFFQSLPGLVEIGLRSGRG